eukprot:gene5173-926_t
MRQSPCSFPYSIASIHVCGNWSSLMRTEELADIEKQNTITDESLRITKKRARSYCSDDDPSNGRPGLDIYRAPPYTLSRRILWSHGHGITPESGSDYYSDDDGGTGGPSGGFGGGIGGGMFGAALAGAGHMFGFGRGRGAGGRGAGGPLPSPPNTCEQCTTPGMYHSSQSPEYSSIPLARPFPADLPCALRSRSGPDGFQCKAEVESKDHHRCSEHPLAPATPGAPPPLPPRCVGSNAFEREVLQEYLTRKGKSHTDCWKEVLESLASGKWAADPDLGLLPTLPSGSSCTADTISCRRCAAAQFERLTWRYRYEIPAEDLPP